MCYIKSLEKLAFYIKHFIIIVWEREKIKLYKIQNK